jgi:hypothetical protein
MKLLFLSKQIRERKKERSWIRILEMSRLDSVACRLLNLRPVRARRTLAMQPRLQVAAVAPQKPLAARSASSSSALLRLPHIPLIFLSKPLDLTGSGCPHPRDCCVCQVLWRGEWRHTQPSAATSPWLGCSLQGRLLFAHARLGLGYIGVDSFLQKS